MMAIALLLITLAMPIQSYAGEPAAGKAIAVAICSACHSIGAHDPGPVAAERRGPDFLSIAARPELARAWLRHFLKTTNARRDTLPGMPNPNLTEDQISDVVEYLMALRADQALP